MRIENINNTHVRGRNANNGKNYKTGSAVTTIWLYFFFFFFFIKFVINLFVCIGDNSF